MTIEHDELDKEWDSRSHTPDEYRREIRELRDRCVRYAKELTELREELRTALAAPSPEPLTDEEALRLWAGDAPRPVMGKNKVLAFTRAIERAHNIKGDKT